MKIYYVYRHTFPNGKVYIGKGKKNRAYRFQLRSKYWHNNYNKYQMVCVEKLKENLTEQEALHIECQVINSYLQKGFTLANSLINFTKGGEGVSGLKHSKESRNKMSKNLMGNTRRKGTKTSLQGIENIRKGQLGKKRSPESIEKTRQYNLGRKRPAEVVKKISIGNTGKKHSDITKSKLSEINKDKTVYTFYNKQLNLVETSTTYQLQTKYNLNTSCIRLVVKGKRKSTGGWTLK